MSAVSARSVSRAMGVDRVRALQRVLYRCAKQDQDRRFHALYDKVARSDVLWKAWGEVRANRGAPGVDGVTIGGVVDSGVSEFLEELAAKLRSGTYRPKPLRRVRIPKPGRPGQLRPLGIPCVADRVVMAAAKIVLEPIFGVSWRSCGRLAGESPVGVMAKQPRSWWPTDRETGLPKRHDKVPLGGEQPTGPYDEESCRLVRLACIAGDVRVPSPAKMGEGDRRREDLGSAAPMDPPGYRERNGWIADHGTGEIRLGTGVMWPRAANSRCPVAAKPISSDPAKRWSAERKSAGVVVVMMVGTTQPGRSEGPLARCVSRARKGCGIAEWLFTRPPEGGLAHALPRALGSAANAVAQRNAGDRLPGGAPDEGEPHVRCGKGALETERL